MARPPPPCIWRMKKIQTPISSSIGNQDSSTPNSDGTLSSSGAAVIRTPLSISRLDQIGDRSAHRC